MAAHSFQIQCPLPSCGMLGLFPLFAAPQFSRVLQVPSMHLFLHSPSLGNGVLIVDYNISSQPLALTWRCYNFFSRPTFQFLQVILSTRF